MRCELPWGYFLDRRFISAGFRPLNCSREVPRSEFNKFPRVNPSLPPANSTARPSLDDLAPFLFLFSFLLFLPDRMFALPSNRTTYCWRILTLATMGRLRGSWSKLCFVKRRLVNNTSIVSGTKTNKQTK